MRSRVVLFCLAVTIGCPSAQADIRAVRWLPLTPIERQALADEGGKIHPLPLPFTPYNTCRPKIPQRVDCLADRNEYMADDPVGQFLVYFIGAGREAPGAALRLEALDTRGNAVVSRTLSPIHEPKVAFLLETGKLAPGEYRLRATLVNVPDAPAIPECTFRRSGEARRVIEFPPDGVPLVVHAQPYVPDAAWPIVTGVPLPRGAAETVNRFVLTENGKPAPAQFKARATWHPDGMVKWMGLDFLARYDNGKPRAYRLIRLPEAGPAPAMATPLKVTESADAFTVDTGAIRFKVGRRPFGGIEEVALINADGAAGAPIVSGAGGPFLMDERLFRYSAASDPHAEVVIEESGPVRLTIAAKGWYLSDDKAEKCCIFQTRITAYAGQPWINVNHRTIITFDTDKKKLRELGFAVKVPGGTRWAFGGDGEVRAGDLPQPIKDARGRPVAPDSIWLHQDRWDHFRLVQGEDRTLAEGKKGDGWAWISAPNGDVAVSLRNMWQLYPKELELSANGLDVHVWPRHGRVAFTEEEEVGDGSIYKLFYAHQGKYLDLKFPQKYFDAIRKKMVALEQQDINALTGNGLGLAATNDFSLYFRAPGSDAKDAAAWAALYQQAPHALTDPVYNGLTEVEGRFAGKSDKFAEAQRILTDGYHGYTMSVDYLSDYGMWIWPDVHNNWSPLSKQAQWHRWWHLSHYQNVWEGLFLYFRSGEPWLYEWARNNTQHYMDVGTVNYDDPDRPMLCRITGANYHTKGFTPWGSPRQGERCGDDYAEVGAHFVNPDANLFRYLLLGDRRGLELCRAWADAFGRVALPPERSRECNATLGEMISYYENTWDPQAILYIRDLAADQNSRPWKEIPAFPGHPMYHDRWVMRYWELTRDPMIRQRILEWFEPGLKEDSVQYGYPQLRALCWRWTGKKEYLTGFASNLSSMWEGIYVEPGDPLNYYGGRSHFFPTHSFAQMGPYYLQALLDAGIDRAPPPRYDGAPVAKLTSLKKDAASYWLVVEKNTYWGRKVGWLMPAGPEPAATIEFAPMVTTNDPMLPRGATVAYIRIEDAEGKTVLDTNILAGSRRPSATVNLDARNGKGPWRIYKSSIDPLFKWTGPAEAVYLGPTAEAVKEAAEGRKPAFADGAPFHARAPSHDDLVRMGLHVPDCAHH